MFFILVPSLQNNLYSLLMIDSCSYCETFKKSFPDGITGNHCFFLRSINARHFPCNAKHLLYRARCIFRAMENWSVSQFCQLHFHSEPQTGYEPLAWTQTWWWYLKPTISIRVMVPCTSPPAPTEIVEVRSGMCAVCMSTFVMSESKLCLILVKLWLVELDSIFLQ